MASRLAHALVSRFKLFGGLDHVRPSPLSPPRLTCEPASGGEIKNSSNTTQLFERTGILSAEAACAVEDTDGIEGHSAGDDIDYTIDLTNTGTTTLSLIVVSADLLPQERYGVQRSGAVL